MVNRNKTKSTGAMVWFRMIISLLIILPVITAFDCKKQDKPLEDECYYDRQGTLENECIFKHQSVNWTIVNSAKGIVDCEFFTSLDCNHTSYNLDLYYVDNVTSAEQCKKSTLMTRHTEKEYRIGQNASYPKCQKNEKIQFKYVYTGCYALKITPKVESSTRRPDTVYRYITTDYVKETYDDHPPIVIHQYRDDDSTLVLTIIDKHLYNDPRMSLELKPRSAHLRDGRHDIYKLVPVQSRRKLVSCRIGGKNSEDGNIQCKMEYKDEIGTATCHVKDVPWGSYVAYIDFFDPVRCRSSTVWGDQNICSWSFLVTTTPPPTPTSATTATADSYTDNQVAFALMAALFVVLLLVIVLLIRYRRILMKYMKKTPLISTRDTESGELQLLSKQKVLVLYPRDCEPFMNAMKALRNVLIKYGNCEVYDIHDAARDEEISEDPESWILRKLQCEEYKTVLFLSQCASLQTRTSVRASSIYRQGRFTDSLFPYAVRVLTQNLKLNSYTKLFVVNLSFDSDEYKLFKFFNPFTRYGLPDNCGQLLSDLIDGRVNYSMVQDSIEFQLFLSSYRLLETYVTDNPTYLQDILNVEVQNREG